jgi:hypothetical protein
MTRLKAASCKWITRLSRARRSGSFITGESEPGNSTVMPESDTSLKNRTTQSSGGSSGILADREVQSRSAKCTSPPHNTERLPFKKPGIVMEELTPIGVTQRRRDTAPFNLESERLELPNALYFQSSIPPSDTQRNAGEQVDTELLDWASTVDASAMSGQVDSNDNFTLTPKEQTALHPTPVSHPTGNHSMVSDDYFLLPQTSYEGFDDDLDSLSDYYVETHPHEPSLLGLPKYNHMENSETLTEADQGLLGLDGCLDDGYWAAFLETESVLAFDGVPQKSKPDGSKKIDTTETNFNDHVEE